VLRLNWRELLFGEATVPFYCCLISDGSRKERQPTEGEFLRDGLRSYPRMLGIVGVASWRLSSLRNSDPAHKVMKACIGAERVNPEIGLKKVWDADRCQRRM
jgi:hypothetical protein